MIHSILLDLDDTILDFKKAERIAVAKTIGELGLQPTDEILDRYHILNKEQWEALEKGLITRDQVKVRRYENLFREFGVNINACEAAANYEKNLGIGHYFVPGAVEFLEKASADYDLYLVSNGTAEVQDSRISSAGISKYFKAIYISEKIGYNKPSCDFFDFVFNDITERINPEFSKDETIIVGDSLTSDILGGKNAGIKTVWFNPLKTKNVSDIKPDYETDTLAGILGICCKQR